MPIPKQRASRVEGKSNDREPERTHPGRDVARPEPNPLRLHSESTTEGLSIEGLGV